jgi:hypothetical protein
MATHDTSSAKLCSRCFRDPEVEGARGLCRYCSLSDEALDAFWDVIVKRFPEAETGDLSPSATVGLGRSATDAIKEWIGNNVPVRCATCGNEIVFSVNDSHFREGECEACECRRYRTQPALVESLDYLLQQTVDMDLCDGIELTEGEKAAREKAIAAITAARIDHNVDSRERQASDA